MRAETLAAILGRHATPVPEPTPATATLEALAGVIALITARLGKIPVDQAELTAGVPAPALIRTLTIFTASALAALLPEDSLTAFLQDLGTEAIRSIHPNGETP
jgi:hypothetical protein